MSNASYSKTMQGGGKSIGGAITRSGEALLSWTFSLPAGNAGELTTRTSDTIGTATMDSAAHTISTGMTVDVHWSGGVRYGVTVGTVAGTSVPFSGGSGDNLPVATTGLVITQQVSANVNIDGDNVQLLGVEHSLPDPDDTGAAHVQFRDSGASEIAELDLTPGVAVIFDIAGGDTNDFTGNPITNIKASNGSSSNSATLIIMSLEDATP